MSRSYLPTANIVVSVARIEGDRVWIKANAFAAPNQNTPSINATPSFPIYARAIAIHPDEPHATQSDLRDRTCVGV
jgi:hypothetical protein